MSLSGSVFPPPLIPTPRSNTSSSPIPDIADEVAINKERAEVYSFQRILDNKMDYLDASIHKLINSISSTNNTLDQANKAFSE